MWRRGFHIHSLSNCLRSQSQHVAAVKTFSSSSLPICINARFFASTSNGEEQSTDSKRKKYALRPFPRRDRLPSYVAELHPTILQPDHYSFNAASQIETIIRYALYVQGHVELQSIPALCSFFCADLTEEMKKAIEEYQGLESIKRSVCSSTHCPFIPNSLRRNLFLFALSEMPRIKEQFPHPSLEDTEQAVSALRENEDGLRTVCAFLKQHPSPFIASLEPSVMGEYLFGSQYCEEKRSAVERAWNSL